MVDLTLKREQDAQRPPVAIAGMSCRFAGAPNPGALWRLVTTRRSGLAPLPLALERPFGTRGLFARPYPAVAGLLGDSYACVPGMQDMPRPLNAGENKDLYFAVQLALDALFDAGMPPRATVPVRGTVRFAYAPPFTAPSVHWLLRTDFLDQTIELLGKCFRGAPAQTLENMRDQLAESLPPLDPAALFTGDAGRMADWIAHVCNFSGAAGACSAGLLSPIAALEAGMDDLLSGRADVALVGALTPPFTRAALEGYAGDVAFTAAPSFAPFARDGTGAAPGEGGAFFVLKRRHDALDAHDRIYALVRGVAMDAQTPPLVVAADAARIPLPSIQLIEADGCGVAEADAAEVAEIQRLWGEHKPGGPLVGIGSVKGNVGHCLHAAPAAALVKTALALQQRTLPPQLPPERPSERLADLNSAVYLLDAARPWIAGDAAAPRRAAVLAADGPRRRAAVLLEDEPEAKR